MGVTVEIREYVKNRGIELVWDDLAEVSVSRGVDGVIILANRAGLETLARHLLTIAQDGVETGSHIHLDEYSGLEDGSVALIMERSPDRLDGERD
ncbi:hypothetical protein [Microbispora sp. NPDC049125]|uniref:Imm32 family immunity protein n=1 Tax=Microbispora sp. NPDC049125 TaxID=3154929 RepID=UPI003466327F